MFASVLLVSNRDSRFGSKAYHDQVSNVVGTDIYYTAVKEFARKEKRVQKRGLPGGFRLPISKMHFDDFSAGLPALGMCLNKNLHSEDDQPVN